VAALLLSSLFLADCTFIKSDSCADQANLSEWENKVRGCDSFLSAEKMRETVYLGDDSARLWAGADYRKAANINAGSVNQPAGTRTPIAAWSGSLRVDVPGDENTANKDIADIKSTGAIKFDPDEKVAVKFEKAPIDFFLKQMLSGALGVPYVASDDLPGSVTFRTEQPIPKSQVLQVVRDVLGRNGLEMRYMSGVYQIGTPDVIASLEQTAAPGRISDRMTRVIRLHKGSAAEVIGFLKQLVPDEVTLAAATSGDSIIVKASPGEIDKVTELVAISDTNVSDDRVAIIPLRQSAPEKIAQQLGEFYRSQAESATIIPLENQQALLVGTRDRRTMQGLKELVRRLDRDTGGDSTLRIIPLVHLGADEVVPLLTTIYANSGQGTIAAPPIANGNTQTPPPPAAKRPSMVPPLQVPRGGTNDDGGFTPGLSLSGGSSGGNGESGNAASAVADTISGQSSAQSIAAAGPAVRFVADTRNNAVMIYSSYSMFKLVRERLKVLDVPQAQVVIEAAVAEVTLGDDLSHGVEAFLTAQGIDVSSSASGAKPAFGANAGGAFLHAQFGVPGARADVILQALQNVTNVKLISTPYLTVIDGKKARLVIGDQIPFSTVTQTAQLTGTTTVTQQITVKDTGIVLEITPKIRPDNSVVLDINQSVSNAKDNNTVGGLTPTISTRSVQSNVIAQSGSTIMLAGLVQEGSNLTESGVPVARTIPVLGDLFKQRLDKATRQELIVLITPRVIRRSAELENITRQMRGMIHIRR
jgi:general secretion pathway protein D